MSKRSLSNSKTESNIQLGLSMYNPKRHSYFQNSIGSPFKARKRIKSYIPNPSFKDSFKKTKDG